MNITSDMTSNYKIFYRSQGPKNKPNSNPNKANFGPISRGKAKTNPIKANFKPNLSKGQNERFCVDKEPYDDINNATRGFYNSEGCSEV